MKPPFKLNLGSGTGRKLDFISIDLYTPEADYHFDITQPFPEPFLKGTVEALYLSHVAEHLSFSEWKRAKKIWFDLLMPGGTIEIACPDIEAVCKRFLESSDEKRWDWVIKNFYGIQLTPGDFHKNGFTLEKLVFDLCEEGFRIKVQDKQPDDAQIHVIAFKQK